MAKIQIHTHNQIYFWNHIEKYSNLKTKENHTEKYGTLIWWTLYQTM